MEEYATARQQDEANDARPEETVGVVLSARDPDQLNELARRLLVAISVDSIMNTTAWEREIGPFDFALCSDFWPHGEVSRKYGVLRANHPHAGTNQPVVFVVDKGGRIQFRKLYEDGTVPDVEEPLSVLAKL